MSFTSFSTEDFVRQRLGDRETEDYFPGENELTNLCWRFIVCRCRATLELDLCAAESRMTPLPTPGVSSVGSFWVYQLSQYEPGIYNRILSLCAFDEYVHQYNHRYALFQANAYVSGDYANPQPAIDEVALLVNFDAITTGPVVLSGYVLNLNRLMHDIFMALANDSGKLAIYQSTLGGATDLRVASLAAQREAGNWLRGSAVYKRPLRGSRR